MNADDVESGLKTPAAYEKQQATSTSDPSIREGDGVVPQEHVATSVEQGWYRWDNLLGKLKGVETNGVIPTPPEDRTSMKTYTAFTLWFTINCSILPISFGMLGPAFGCSLRDSALVILFFSLLTGIIPAYIGTLGPKTGMRQMIQARFSFGRYLVAIPVLFNMATLAGFCVIMVVIGGQCLSAVSSGNLSPSVGIVIVSILSLIISFCGLRILHIYELVSWAPALICIIIATGCGGSHLKEQTPVEYSGARPIVSFAMVVASYLLPWAAIASDFFIYTSPKVNSKVMFWYAYVGLCLPTILLLTLGAAIGGAYANVESWAEGYENNMVGGVMAAMLQPAKGFGKFVTVILSFSLLGNIAATSYSISLNFQILLPFLVKVPRYVFAVIITAIIIPVGIKSATNFFANLENFITLIGYWASAFLAVVLIEHLWFRRGDYASYRIEDWDNAKALPLGIAPIVAALCSIGLIVPSMDQVWWLGPIAKTTGDLGFEFAFFVTGILYFPFRTLEKKWSGR